VLRHEVVPVRVGEGRKAHYFSPSPGADAKLLGLRDGETAYDYVLCGASGELRLAEDLELCRTCASLRERVESR
jgi:hypothetical protein